MATQQFSVSPSGEKFPLPSPADYQAEIGAFYNLHGDRARAEELFARSFAKDPSDVWATANAAGSYVNVRPQ